MSARRAAPDPPRRRPELGTNPIRASVASARAAPPSITHALPAGFPTIRAGEGLLWGPRGLGSERLRSPPPLRTQARPGGHRLVGAKGDRSRPGTEPRPGRPASTPSHPVPLRTPDAAPCPIQRPGFSRQEAGRDPGEGGEEGGIWLP